MCIEECQNLSDEIIENLESEPEEIRYCEEAAKHADETSETRNTSGLENEEEEVESELPKEGSVLKLLNLFENK